VDLRPAPTGLHRRDVILLAKIGLASVLAWWFSELLGASRPAFAAIVPLVALRVDDPYGAVGISLYRVVGTVLGVLVGIGALAIDPDVPLWLVAATVAVSLAIGLVARAKSDPINPITAVTALIVLFIGKGRADAYAWERVWQTLVGAGTTMLVAAVVWPPDPIEGLRDLLADLRTEVSADLRELAAFPGMPLAAGARALDERIRRTMDTGDVTRTLDQARNSLRWNPRHRGRTRELIDLAVPIRQLMAMSRYSRSLLWSMMGDPVGDHIRRWEPDAQRAFEDAIGHADDAATALADGQDPSSSIAAADTDLAAFAARVGGSEGHELAADIRSGVRAMLRVLAPSTSDRLRGLVLERYGSHA
jgi:uncharacterized membrane protein YgaE (UPF0421/DUF939 family)